jgi:autoinducer 2-degrading protein
MHTLLLILISAVMLAPQAPSDSSFYSVVYVEVGPSSKGAAVAAFKQYRDASRKDDGFVRLELFEQAGWSGNLVLIETWANPKAFDVHNTAAHTRDWRQQIDEIRLSEFDQRPYKTLTLGAGPAGSRSNIPFVISHVDIGGGGPGANAADLLRRHAEASRKEPGNVRFDVLQHNMRANHFTVIEAWQDDKALQAHASAPHTRQYRDGLGPITGSPLDQRRYTLLE